MEIFVAQPAGFCFGVSRAIEMAEKFLVNKNIKKIFFGELVHNPGVLQKFFENGFYVENNPEKIPKDSVVFLRAHGVSEKTKQKILRRRVKIIDTTCPLVKKMRQVAKKFCQQKIPAFIIGKKQHPEVAAILQDFPKITPIFSDDEASKILLPANLEIGVFCQTTEKKEKCQDIIDILKNRGKKVIFQNTICGATQSRQVAAKNIAKKVDQMIVLGGKNSSNCRKIYEICQKFCPTIWLESPEEIDQKKFLQIKKLGIAAGASTPATDIEKIGFNLSL